MYETSDVSGKYYVYLLLSLHDRGFYIGYTTDLRKRLSEHLKGRVESTKDRLPFKLIHYEYFLSSKDAKAREKYLKSGYGRKQLASILKQTLLHLL